VLNHAYFVIDIFRNCIHSYTKISWVKEDGWTMVKGSSGQESTWVTSVSHSGHHRTIGVTNVLCWCVSRVVFSWCQDPILLQISFTRSVYNWNIEYVWQRDRLVIVISLSFTIKQIPHFNAVPFFFCLLPRRWAWSINISLSSSSSRPAIASGVCLSSHQTIVRKVSLYLSLIPLERLCSPESIQERDNDSTRFCGNYPTFSK
jgi:hypothetical protein